MPMNPDIQQIRVSGAPRRLRRLALVGNFLPRRCGIATFTTDVFGALRSQFPDLAVDVYAMDDVGQSQLYPSAVLRTIDQEDPASYRRAARAINASGADIVWIQHEFGIFGGPAGCHVLDLIEAISAPVAVTLHTVLENPSPEQREVMQGLVDQCALLMVMAQTGREILMRVHGAPHARIEVIPHGVPDRAYMLPDIAKRQVGLCGRNVIMTFGLLSPTKGIETVITALPSIVANCPKAIYIIAGATHPHLVAREGENYRKQLEALAEALGVAGHVLWVDRFLGFDDLMRYLAATDVYVTPYLNPAQITSGTLAYAFALGKPIVSTPYAHALELLADGHGVLADFRDSSAFASAISGLLLDAKARQRMAYGAYRAGRAMIWSRFVERGVQLFETRLIQAKADASSRDAERASTNGDDLSAGPSGDRNPQCRRSDCGWPNALA